MEDTIKLAIKEIKEHTENVNNNFHLLRTVSNTYSLNTTPETLPDKKTFIAMIINAVKEYYGINITDEYLETLPKKESQKYKTLDKELNALIGVMLNNYFYKVFYYTSNVEKADKRIVKLQGITDKEKIDKGSAEIKRADIKTVISNFCIYNQNLSMKFDTYSVDSIVLPQVPDFVRKKYLTLYSMEESDDILANNGTGCISITEKNRNIFDNTSPSNIKVIIITNIICFASTFLDNFKELVSSVKDVPELYDWLFPLIEEFEKTNSINKIKTANHFSCNVPQMAKQLIMPLEGDIAITPLISTTFLERVSKSVESHVNNFIKQEKSIKNQKNKQKREELEKNRKYKRLETVKTFKMLGNKQNIGLSDCAWNGRIFLSIPKINNEYHQAFKVFKAPESFVSNALYTIKFENWNKFKKGVLFYTTGKMSVKSFKSVVDKLIFPIIKNIITLKAEMQNINFDTFNQYNWEKQIVDSFVSKTSERLFKSHILLEGKMRKIFEETVRENISTVFVKESN